MYSVIARYWERLVFLLLFLTIVVSLSYYLLAQYRVLGEVLFPLDDAWIHLTFARNVAEGNGFAFNAGYPIASSTAPLWTLLLATTYKVIPDLYLVAYLWGAICLILTAFFSFKLACLLSENRPWSLVMSLFVAGNPWLAWAALSGMEITLSAFLVLLSIYFYLFYGKNENWKRFIGIALAAIAVLTRPELYILVLTLCVVDAWRVVTRKKGWRGVFRQLGYNLLIVFLVNMPYTLFSLRSCGQIFPCTYNAKVGELGLLGVLGQRDISKIFAYLLSEPFAYWEQFIRAFWNFESAFFLLWIPSLLLLLIYFFKKGEERFLFLPAFLLFFFLSVGLFIPKSRFGFPWNRYLQNLLPLFIISSLLGFYFLLTECKGFWQKILLTGLIVLVMLTAIYNQVNFVIPYVKNFYVDCGYMMGERHTKVAQWLSENVGLDEKIAASDIGYIGYATGRFVVDTEGLITPGILGETRDGLEKDAIIYQYLHDAEVSYLATFKAAYPGLPRGEMEVVFDTDSMAIYRMPWAGD